MGGSELKPEEPGHALEGLERQPRLEALDLMLMAPIERRHVTVPTNF